MRLRIIGPGRAGGSLQLALTRAGWHVETPLGRGAPLGSATAGVDAVVIATPDAAIGTVAGLLRPDPRCAVVHLSGSLGLAPLAGHHRRAVVHPLVALPDPTRGADRLRGAWYGLAVDGDPVGTAIVEALVGRSVTIADGDWARYHAAAVIASNHLVALLGQAERVAGSIGVPLAALLDLARGSLRDVDELGPRDALTGPVRRGDTGTVARHIEALPTDERPAYLALSDQAARLVPPAGGVNGDGG